MESKYLAFDEYITPSKKTSMYEVRNKATSDILGVIYFYPAWRKYVFESNADIIYDAGCLTDIINFMQGIQTEWRESLKEGKAL